MLMARVARSGEAFAPDGQPCAPRPSSTGEQRLLHVVRLRRIPLAHETQPVELRVEYLIVAGT